MISSYSQCLLSFGKINIFTDGNIGVVATTDLGKGYEIAGGLGAEWAPFNKVFYIITNVKHVNHFLTDNSPKDDLFPDNPNSININSKIIRGQYGLKMRFDWRFKKNRAKEFNFFLGAYFLIDILIENKLNLFYDNSLTMFIINKPDEKLGGKLYEIGYSWAPDNIKLDFSMYAYGIAGNSKYENYKFFLSKIGFGITTSFIIVF